MAQTALLAAFVAWREVDVHAPLCPKRRGLIPDLANLAVRRGLIIFKRGLSAGQQEHALQARDALLDHRVFRIKRAHAIYHERIAIKVGRQRANSN